MKGEGSALFGNEHFIPKSEWDHFVLNNSRDQGNHIKMLWVVSPEKNDR